MTAIRLVTKSDQALKNIESFQTQVRSNGGNNELARTLSHFRSWYASEKAGEWIFAPSKFIGYIDLTADSYGANTRDLDGRKTEAALRSWFAELPLGAAHDDLHEKLQRFVSIFGKQPSTLARISTLRPEATNTGLERPGAIVEALLTLYREMPPPVRQDFRRRIMKEA